MSFMDAIGQAKQVEDAGRQPYIAVKDFWTAYKPMEDGSIKEVDMVSWIKKGQQHPPVIDCAIHRMPKHYVDVWKMVEPLYKKWKEGQEAPIDGTPLAAWPGATPQLVKALEPLYVRSVEDLVRMQDSDISKINLPGMRPKIAQAKAFLEAQRNTAGVSQEVVLLREENEFMRKEIAEMRAMLDQMTAPEAKRGPGRPPKQRPEFNPDNDGTRVA